MSLGASLLRLVWASSLAHALDPRTSYGHIGGRARHSIAARTDGPPRASLPPQCTFIEAEGDIVFFKNQHGEAIREYVEPKAGAKAEAEVEEREDDALKLAGL